MASDLTILVLSYRTPGLLRACLTRLKELAPEAPIHVLDASSGDNSRRVAESFDGVRFHERPNHSMANLLNEGLMLVETPYILQLNADVIVSPEALPKLRAALAQPRVGMVGPRCFTPQGRPQRQGFLYRRYHWWLENTGRPWASVRWLSGCCTLLRAEAVSRVGGMNASFRFYNEDIEWSWRFRRAGYRCLLVNTPVLHVGGASTARSARLIAEGLRGGYQLSRMRYPKLVRLAHWLGLWGYALAAPRLSRDPEVAQAAALVRQMLTRQLWLESPCGETLAETNARYRLPAR